MIPQADQSLLGSNPPAAPAPALTGLASSCLSLGAHRYSHLLRRILKKTNSQRTRPLAVSKWSIFLVGAETLEASRCPAPRRAPGRQRHPRRRGPGERTNAEQRVGCSSGTLTQPAYRDLLLAAGFTNISITSTHEADAGLHSVIIQAAFRRASSARDPGSRKAGGPQVRQQLCHQCSW